MSGSQVSFAYGGKVGAIVALTILQVIIGSFIFLAAMQGDRNAVVPLFLFALFFLVIFGLMIFGRSNVVLSDDGIARSLWGWTWRRIAWDNVDHISEFLVSKGNGQFAWALNIFPKVKPSPRFTPSGKVFFGLDAKDSAELIRRLNQCIARHDLTLTVRHTMLGEPEPAKELLS